MVTRAEIVEKDDSLACDGDKQGHCHRHPSALAFSLSVHLPVSRTRCFPGASPDRSFEPLQEGLKMQLIADALAIDVGPRSASTIKLRFIRRALAIAAGAGGIISSQLDVCVFRND
jgi:hypothetical protein